MIIDCCTFLNEFDLLKIRYEELKDVVDYFFVAESTMTFSGKFKPTYLKNKNVQYENMKKIIVDDMPQKANAWQRESFQRNKILEYLKDFDDEDIVIISDVDEIPDSNMVLKIKDLLEENERVRLIHPTYYYYLNGKRCNMKCGGAAKLKTLRENNLNLQNLRVGSGKYKCKTYSLKGGWHFSYLGGIESIQEKLKSFSHTEYNKEKFINKNNLESKIEAGEDILHRSSKVTYVEIDNSFPKYVCDNKDLFKHLIKDISFKRKRKRVFIGARWGHHVSKWLKGLIQYFKDKDWEVEHTKGHGCSQEYMEEQAAKSDLVFLWNGQDNNRCYTPAKKICKEKNIPCYFLEVGYFPQRKFFTIDSKGINATSELMEDDLSWINDYHINKMNQKRIDYIGDRKRINKGYVFVPLQVEADSNIILHSPFKDMQSFINHVEEKFKGEKIIFKQHPREKKKFKSSFEILYEGDHLDLILGAKCVYGINSTVLLEAALLDVPVEAIGEGFLKRHKNNIKKIIAALVDRQIPVGERNLDYWINPIIKKIEK